MSKSSQSVAASEVLQNAGAISVAGSTLTVCLASSLSKTDMPIFERLQLADELTGEFRNVVYSVLGKCKKSLGAGESVLAVYEAGSRPDGCEIEYLATQDHGYIDAQIHSLGPTSGLPVFQANTDFISRLRFYVIVVEPPTGDPLLLFRVYSPSRELSRSKLFLAIFSEGQYDRIKDSGFLFDENIDCLYYGGLLFILNKNNFQRIFNFFEMVKKSAIAALDLVEKNIPIENFDEFKIACQSHLQKLAKLKNISERPYLKSLTVDILKKVIVEFDLPIKTVRVDEIEKIVFDASDKWAILKLLDEDYLNSSLTGNKYEATGKRSMTITISATSKSGH